MTRAEKLKKIFANPVLFIESFVKIVDKSGKLVPFKLNEQQNELVNGLDKYNIVLKSRQLGITSVSCAISLYHAITKPNTTCLLMSYSLESATGIFEKLKQMYYEIPESIRVGLMNNNKKELKFVNGSRIVIATCGTKDVARGLTITYAHLSEVGFMKETVGKQLLAIEQALTPNGKIVLESTANGLNYFSELWNKAESKESMYKPFFFNWIDDKVMFKDEYEMFAKTWIDRHGSLPDVKELNEIERVLKRQGATIKQLVWRRLKIANSSEQTFAQEFPSNPLEAFVTTGSNVFNSAKIHEILSHINNPIPKPIDLPISIKMYYGRSFFMWEDVKPNERYYVGVDTSEGLKQDYSTIIVLNSDGFQVAEFASNDIKPYQFSEVVYDLGIYFNYAYLVVEKASAGHVIVDKLKNDYKYKNLHKHKDYDKRGKMKKRVGFLTNAKTKPIIINDYVELFETNQIFINSKSLLNEMKLFTFSDGKMAASQGHDDLVLSMAMAIHGMKNGVNYKI